MDDKNTGLVQRKVVPSKGNDSSFMESQSLPSNISDETNILKKFEMTKTVVDILIKTQIAISFFLITIGSGIIQKYHNQDKFHSEVFILSFVICLLLFFGFFLLCVRSMWPINILVASAGIGNLGFIIGFTICLRLKDITAVVQKQL